MIENPSRWEGPPNHPRLADVAARPVPARSEKLGSGARTARSRHRPRPITGDTRSAIGRSPPGRCSRASSSRRRDVGRRHAFAPVHEPYRFLALAPCLASRLPGGLRARTLPAAPDRSASHIQADCRRPGAILAGARAESSPQIAGRIAAHIREDEVMFGLLRALPCEGGTVDRSGRRLPRGSARRPVRDRPVDGVIASLALARTEAARPTRCQETPPGSSPLDAVSALKEGPRPVACPTAGGWAWGLTRSRRIRRSHGKGGEYRSAEGSSRPGSSPALILPSGSGPRLLAGHLQPWRESPALIASLCATFAGDLRLRNDPEPDDGPRARPAPGNPPRWP